MWSHLIYLNHAGTSWPKPKPVLQTAEQTQLLGPDQWPQLFEDCTATVAKFFGTGPDRWLFTPGCTSALNLAMRELPWRPGDRIVTSHFEHHALHRNAVALKQLAVTFDTVPFGSNELIVLEDLERQLSRSPVRLVAMTGACNVTGLMLPIREVVEIAHRHGALVLIDGAQIAGWCDLDLPALGVDLFTFAGHKGLQSPMGVGGLYLSAEIPMECPTSTCEVSSRPQRGAIPGYCDAGSANLPALSGLAAGCGWLNKPSQQSRLQSARQVAARFSDVIREDKRVTIYHDSSFDRRMPTVAFTMKGTSTTELGRTLRDQGIIVSAGFQCASQAHGALRTVEEGVLRVSFGPQSDGLDVESIGRRIISAGL